MSGDRISEYLRSRGQVSPPPGFVQSVMTAVDEAPPADSWFIGYLPAAAFAGAVALVVALAILLGGGPNVGPEPSRSLLVAEPASVEELRDALDNATERLREAPSVQGLQTAHTRQYLATATWFDYRANGDQVVIQRQDTDITMTGWWMDPNGDPPAVGERLLTSIWVFTDDSFYFGDGGEWQVADRRDSPPVVSFGPGILSGQIDPLQPLEGLTPRLPDPDDGSVSSRPTADGDRVWTLTMPYRDGTAASTWRIDSTGALRSWSWDLMDVSPDPEVGNFTTSSRLEFTPLQDAEPILPPDTESVPDPADLGLPTDFPMQDD
jgi:hypothetical protein